MQLRRVFATIWEGHISPEINVSGETHYTISDYLPIFEELMKADWIEAAAWCHEEADSTGGEHLHLYMEMKPKRLKTLANHFGLMETCFETVKDASGSWDYILAKGKHDGKPQIYNNHFGEPKLYGSKEKVDLHQLVNLIIDGVSLRGIMRMHPYHYCVHRDRLTKFSEDWNSKLTVYNN